ncbi:hypothetical protein J3A83DRAFT_2667359 [Scleroderma citrinum]
MSSPHSLYSVAAILLLVPIPLLSLVLIVRLWMSAALALSPAIFLVLIAISSAAAGAVKFLQDSSAFPDLPDTALEAALECILSAATLFILHGYSQRIFSSLYAFTTVLIVCELVSSAIPQSPALLSAIFSGIVRVLCVVLFILVIRACPSDSYQDNSDIEKHGLDQLSSPHGFPARVSSPIPETWPFPASLALARPSTEHSPRNDFMAAKLLSSFPLWGATEHTNSSTKSTSPSTILILAGSQFFALLCAAVKIVMAVVVSHTTKTTLNQDVNSFVTLCHLFIAHAVFRSLWGVLLLLVIYGQF